MNPEVRPADLGHLIRRAREKLTAREFATVRASGAERLSEYRRRFPEVAAERSVVLAEDTAVELGPPSRAAVNMVLWTTTPRRVEDGRVSLVGSDLNAGPPERDYAQVVMLGLEKPVNPFTLESRQFLARRLPGIMARMVPGRLWLRVSREALAAGADFALLAAALRESYREELSGAAVECIFITAGREEVEDFSGLAAECRILTGRHKKITLAADGDYECEELNCEGCADKPVCDRIREVAVIRRGGRRAP